MFKNITKAGLLASIKSGGAPQFSEEITVLNAKFEISIHGFALNDFQVVFSNEGFEMLYEGKDIDSAIQAYNLDSELTLVERVKELNYLDISLIEEINADIDKANSVKALQVRSIINNALEQMKEVIKS